MSNGEMIAELRTLAACEHIETEACMRLMLAALAQMFEKQQMPHNHDELYAKRDHSHPWHLVTSTVATIGATVGMVWATLKH